MASDLEQAALTKADQYGVGGAFGAGAVLVVLPCVALFFGVDRIAASPAVGLPILAVFGIMILFGALALISTLFARLGLQDTSQALALPEGSIRAAIAMSLIVLFAIISIMLYQAVAKPYIIEGLEAARMQAMVKESANGNNIIAVVPDCITRPAPAKGQACAADDVRYAVHLRQPAGQESTDLAKQLLILVGTLMTSVVSFYFASKAVAPKAGSLSAAEGQDPASVASVASAGPAPLNASLNAMSAQAIDGDTDGSADAHVDGCDVDITDPTPDEALPAARGGVS